jgi:Cellulase (glycosyl hydrolase family 5)
MIMAPRRLCWNLWSLMLFLVAAAPCHAQADQAPAATIALEPDRAGLKGMVGHWWYIQKYGDALLDHYVHLGVTNVRLAVDWRDIEEFGAGQRNYAHLDPIMDAFADRGIEVIPVVATIPVWASLNPVECASDTQVCSLDITKLGAFQSTMEDLVARYPEVRRWEFWNEPEMWAGLRRASDFEPWYRAFYTAAKSVDPRLQVAIGTLSGWDFVSRLSPSLPMDAVSLHPYAGDDWGLDTNAIERLHLGLLARGVDVPVWITEYGWAQWMDPVRRAETLARVFDWMRKQRYIQVADYHMLHDGDDTDECCWGLVGPAPALLPHEPAYSMFGSITVSNWQRVPRAHPARPSNVVAAAPPPHAEPAPPPEVQLAAAPINTESTTDAATIYYVAAGDTLKSIALDVYGEQDAWPSIYDMNATTIGPDPDVLVPGVPLRVPRPG